MTTENSKTNSYSTHSEKPLVIIPAAGYGIRVGRPAAKELLLNDLGEPLISYALNQAKRKQWPVHVITRKEKQSLIDFLNDYSVINELEIQIQVIEPSREWPDSVLRSQSFWHEKNLLCLPDTVFDPPDIGDSLIESLSTDIDIALGLFEPSQGDLKWGFVCPRSEYQIQICEKPSRSKENMMAWGLSAFTRSGGLELLNAQLKSTFDHSWIPIQSRAHLHRLTRFHDLTRS